MAAVARRRARARGPGGRPLMPGGTATAATMTAATVVAPGVVRLDGRPAPEPGNGEVLIRVEGCGVCGSNVPVWEGRPWFDYPLRPGEPGHEGWGRVERLGPGVSGLEPGTRVAYLSQTAFAEFDLVPAGHVVALPDELDDTPVPGEALGCALNVLERSRIAASDRVAIVGAGFLGLLLVQLAAAAGARVTAFGRRPFVLQLATELGAADATLLTEAPQSANFDCAIEAAGVQATLDVASRLVRERGLLVIAGYHQDGRREVDLQSWNWRGLDVVNAHERDPSAYLKGMRHAVEAVRKGVLQVEPLLTHRFALHELDHALDAARDRPDGFVKAVVLT